MAGLFAGQPLFKTIGGAIAGTVATLAVTAMLTISSGGQLKIEDISDQQVLFSNNSIVAGDSGMTFSSSTNVFTATNILMTNGTGTRIAADTLCLTGDTCRTTWPTSGGGSGVGWSDDGSILYNSTPTRPVVVWSSVRSPQFMATSTGIGFAASGTIAIAGSGTSTFSGAVSSTNYMAGFGTAGQPSYGFSGGSGMMMNGPTQLAIAFGGALKVFVDAGDFTTANQFRPLNNGTLDNGLPTAMWRNGYYSGQVSSTGLLAQNTTSTNATTTNLAVVTSARLPSNTLLNNTNICLSDGTNCPSSYSVLTITTLSSTNINVRNIREANGSVASSTITLSGRSGEIDTTTTPRPTSTLLTLSGIPRTLPAMNASTTNCVYWGPEYIRDSWDGLLLKPTLSWTNASGSGAVVWRVRAESITDNEYIGTGWSGNSSFATGTVGTGYFNQNDAMDNLTVGGATTGTPMRFELCRIGGQAGDTFGADAYPNSLKIEYGLGSYSD